MRLKRGFTNKEWKEISEKYKDGGVHMYRGKKTLFYNGEKLWEWGDNWGNPLIYDEKERSSWDVIIVLPGVEIIPEFTFTFCRNLKVVIMTDTVKRIEEDAFFRCDRLKFVKLSRSLEFIGRIAFCGCYSLASIFIPPSCSEIGDGAFESCVSLLILSMPQNVQLGEGVFQDTAMIKKSSIETDVDGYYNRNDDSEQEVVRWVKSINSEEAYALHRAGSSFNPIDEIIHDLIKQQGIKAMRMKNAIGITPSQYLEANTFTDISEKEIVKRFILDSMGEVF